MTDPTIYPGQALQILDAAMMGEFAPGDREWGQNYGLDISNARIDAIAATKQASAAAAASANNGIPEFLARTDIREATPDGGTFVTKKDGTSYYVLPGDGATIGPDTGAASHFLGAWNADLPFGDKMGAMFDAAMSSPTVQSSLQIVGGLGEIAAGVAMSGTGIGAVIGAGVGFHGLDTFAAGVTGFQSGQVEQSLTYTAAAAVAGPQNAAEFEQFLGLAAGVAGLATGAGGIAPGVPQESRYGVAFFGDTNLKYYGPNATFSAPGRPFFFMPLEDSAVVTDAASAARYTGMAPSAERAYLAGGDVYGVSFPTEGMSVRVPAAADAGGWPHYLEGGYTAVRTEGSNAGYLVNSTREFVVPGGSPMPAGSVLFKVEQGGAWTQLWKW